jgi:hypothetical protein
MRDEISGGNPFVRQSNPSKGLQFVYGKAASEKHAKKIDRFVELLIRRKMRLGGPEQEVKSLEVKSKGKYTYFQLTVGDKDSHIGKLRNVLIGPRGGWRLLNAATKKHSRGRYNCLSALTKY